MNKEIIMNELAERLTDAILNGAPEEDIKEMTELSKNIIDEMKHEHTE